MHDNTQKTSESRRHLEAVDLGAFSLSNTLRRKNMYCAAYCCHLYLNISLSQPMCCFSVGKLGSIGQDSTRKMPLDMGCLHHGRRKRSNEHHWTHFPSGLLPVKSSLQDYLLSS